MLEGRLIRRRFRRHWKNYLLQCGLSTLALLMVLLVVDVVLQAAIVVAIASSAFIVFIMPHSKASIPRRVIGGHLVAIVVAAALGSVDIYIILGICQQLNYLQNNGHGCWSSFVVSQTCMSDRSPTVSGSSRPSSG